MPSSTGRATGLLGRLASMLGRRSEAESRSAAAAHARWPHLWRSWLDPDVPLHGWRSTIDVADAPDALGAIASASGGRLGEAEVSEMLDLLAQLPVDEPRSFRFDGDGPNAFAQIWVGLVRNAPESVRVFLLGDQDVADAAQEALTVGRFAGRKRAEYEELSRFYLETWEWRWTAKPASLRTAAPAGSDRGRLGERMRRVLSDPSAPLLELLRGLRGRVRELVAGMQGLDAADVAAADAFLAARGAPTLTEMRRRLREAG